MIGYLYSLPQGFTSPDDKPCLELFEWGVASPTLPIYEAMTIERPTIEEVVIQTGISDNSLKDMQMYNYVQINGTKGKTDGEGYQVDNISITEATVNVFEIHAKIDLYLTFVVSYFNTTGAMNDSPVYFKQKHMNRWIYPNGLPIVFGGSAVNPRGQFYLLSRYKQLENVGSKVNKTVINAHQSDYFKNYPDSNVNSNNGYKAGLKSGSNYPTDKGVIPAQFDDTASDNPTGITHTGYANNDDLYYPNFYQTLTGGGNYNGNPECYPCILGYVTPNEMDLYPNPPYPFPYGLSGIGGTQTCLGNASFQVDGTTGGYANPSQSNVHAGVPGYDLVVDGAISDKYYSGVYLLPLPINCYFNQLTNGTTGNYATWTTVANITGVPTLQKVFNASAFNPNGTGSITSSTLPDYYYTWVDPCIYIAQNNLYTSGQGKLNDYVYDDLTNIEPALINYMRCNVRMYGQDNFVDISSFFGPTANQNNNLNGALASIIPYLMSFTLTVAPPNMMLTNTPMSVYVNSTDELYMGVGNYNNYNDAIYSCVLKSQAPNVSNNGNNYMATSRNAYDTGLNVSQLMAQKSLVGGLGAGASSAMSGNIIGAIFNPLGDIFSAIGQEIRYSYELTGKKQDYSRTSNMRTSATSTINTLYDSSFMLVLEVPPLYEQVMVVNYYALHGYKLERWVPFKYGYNRKICNFVSILFFTNALMTGLNTMGKGRIDKMLETGFRVGSAVDSLLPSITTTTGMLDYSLVLITSSGDSYPNQENNINNDELQYLLGANNSEVSATYIQTTKKDKSK